MFDIHVEINPKALEEQILALASLDDSKELYEAVASIQCELDKFKEAERKVEELQSDLKLVIDRRATELYGSWKAISGEGYKISKSPTGAVYSIHPDTRPNKKFIKVTEAVDTDKVSEYVTEHGKLPKGIDINPKRGATVKIAVSL